MAEKDIKRNLQVWQERLQRHFAELHRARGSGRPVFGLEHGLSKSEFEKLADAIRIQVADQTPRREHRLAWVVYASEFGYLYAGDEYWQTFESQTPGWDIHGDRYWIRECFRDFHKQYGGARPSGPWAEHFTIICWPITNAILPRDLQRHLAKILYELRFQFLEEELSSPIRLGELIASQSWDTSLRFQQLAQEPLFVGQIATALILPGNPAASLLILPQTLERIDKDLESIHRARNWLKGAREGVQQRFQVRHITLSEGGITERNRITREEVNRRVDLRPRLFLIPTDDNAWAVWLELPNMSSIPVQFPQLVGVFKNSRCHVMDLSKPGKWLLYGPQSVILRKWPRQGQQLLDFEPSTPEWKNILQAECRLHHGPIWLFKIAEDGLAHELRSTIVRAGHRYILLLEGERNADAHPSITKVTVQCNGIHALLLDLPEAIPPDLAKSLEALGIQQTGLIHVWPAGLTPTRWDGEGEAEWLSTDRPCVGVCADHPVAAFSFELDSGALEVPPQHPGESVFVEILGLDVGLYTLGISALAPNGERIAEPTSLNIRIRKPQIWVPGGNSQGAFMVFVHPNVPTLEQLWEGQMEIELYGPTSRRAKCSIAFYERGGSRPLLQRTLPPVPLPINSATWRRHLDQHFRKVAKVQNSYDLAHSYTLRFEADEIGAFCITGEREFSPLRWVIRRTKWKYFLQLLDDSGAGVLPHGQRHEFGAPDIGNPIEVAIFCPRGGEEATGGLYVAQSAIHQSAVIIPPEFEDLGIEPKLTTRKRIQQDVIELVKVLDLWAGARQTGNIFSMYIKRQVLSVLLREIFCLIGGERWTEVEDAFNQASGGHPLQVAQRALLKKPVEAGLVDIIHEQLAELSTLSPIDRAKRFKRLLTRQYVCEDTPDLIWLSEFAIRLASCSKGSIQWVGDRLPEAVSRLFKTPAIARAARFMVMTIAQQHEPTDYGTRLYEGWDWE